MVEKIIIYKIKNEDGKYFSGERYDYTKKKEAFTFGDKGKAIDTIDWAISIVNDARKSGIVTDKWIIEPHVRKPTHSWDKETSRKFSNFLNSIGSVRISIYIEELFLLEDFDYPHISIIKNSFDKKDAINNAIKGIKKDNIKRKTWNANETIIRFKSVKDLLKFKVSFEHQCIIIEDLREVLS
jgi:hypothetical protein